jgi:hypothetical protein
MKANRTILVLALLSLLLASSQIAIAQDKPSDVDVTVHHDNGNGWVISPTWMAIGGIAVLALIALVVGASRRGGPATTIVKE